MSEPSHFLKSITLDGLLSFRPGSDPIPLEPLNVLIGPNGSGKSNLIEAIGLLHAAPTGFAAAIRAGGSPADWLWKGEESKDSAGITALLGRKNSIEELRYHIAFGMSVHRTEITREFLEDGLFDHDDSSADNGESSYVSYYSYRKGNARLRFRDLDKDVYNYRIMAGKILALDESILSQRKDSELYAELTWVGDSFSEIQMFTEWGVGRFTEVRKPQPTDLPSGPLLPDARNLGLILNRLEHLDAAFEFNRLLTHFLPRYSRFSTLIQGGTVQVFLHEEGLKAPIPATRISDGTLRFMAMLAVLLSPEPSPMICLEEPELGLHPDGLSLIADLLVEASSRTQLVVTTHSDALISALTDHASSVLVCENIGGTVVERVDAEKLKFWLERYQLGEVWRIGQLGGNP